MCNIFYTVGCLGTSFFQPKDSPILTFLTKYLVIFSQVFRKKKLLGYFEPKAKCRPTPSFTIRPIGFCTSQTSKLTFLVPKGIFPSLQKKDTWVFWTQGNFPKSPKKLLGYFEPKAKCQSTPSFTIRPIGFCTSQTSKLTFLVPKGIFPSLQKKDTWVFWTQGKMSLGLLLIISSTQGKFPKSPSKTNCN
jgi:hypothetical protein